MTGPTWKVPADDKAWIAEKIHRDSDEQFLKMAIAHSDKLAGKTPSEPETPEPQPEPVPVDPAAEQAAFADLLKFIADNPEDDCEFTALSPEEFAEASFTPPVTEPKE